LEEVLSLYGMKAGAKVNGAQLVEKLKAGSYYSDVERHFFIKVLGNCLLETCAR